MIEWRSKYRFQLQVAALIGGVLAPLIGYIGLVDHFSGMSIGAAVGMLLAVLIVVWVG